MAGSGRGIVGGDAPTGDGSGKGKLWYCTTCSRMIMPAGAEGTVDASGEHYCDTCAMDLPRERSPDKAGAFTAVNPSVVEVGTDGAAEKKQQVIVVHRVAGDATQRTYSPVTLVMVAGASGALIAGLLVASFFMFTPKTRSDTPAGNTSARSVRPPQPTSPAQPVGSVEPTRPTTTTLAGSSAAEDRVPAKSQTASQTPAAAAGSVGDLERGKNPLNLLALVDPAKDALSGTWKLQDGTLVSNAVGFARVKIPYHPPAEYDFRVSFTRLSGNDSVVLILSKTGRTFDWLMGGWENTRTGFVDSAGPPRACADAALTNGQRYTVTVQIRNDGVKVYVGDKCVDQRKTDCSDISGAPQWRLDDGTILGLGTNRSPTVFHSVEVMEASGQGRTSRNDTVSVKDGPERTAQFEEKPKIGPIDANSTGLQHWPEGKSPIQAPSGTAAQPGSEQSDKDRGKNNPPVQPDDGKPGVAVAPAKDCSKVEIPFTNPAGLEQWKQIESGWTITGGTLTCTKPGLNQRIELVQAFSGDVVVSYDGTTQADMGLSFYDGQDESKCDRVIVGGMTGDQVGVAATGKTKPKLVQLRVADGKVHHVEVARKDGALALSVDGKQVVELSAGQTHNPKFFRLRLHLWDKPGSFSQLVIRKLLKREDE